MNLNQLETFVAVVEHGSFTRAADALFLAQSTVSNHIQLLEKSLGKTLFVRDTKKNITLTPDGHRIYQFAKDILAQCSVLEESISDDSKCQLYIGASTVPSETILPGLIHDFVELHSECRFVVKSGDSGQIQRMLLDGEIAIGFLGASDNRQDLLYERIAEDRFVMITPRTPHFVELHQRGLYGRNLLNEPIIFRENGSGTQKVIDNYLSSIDVKQQNLNIVAYVSNSGTQKELVALGTGVAVISELLARDLLISGKALHFEMDKSPLSRNIYMAKCRKGILSPIAMEFEEFVREYVADRDTENKLQNHF